MTTHNVTLLFELSEILDELEGVFIHINYEFDENSLIKNGFKSQKNLKIKKISGNSNSQLYMSDSDLKKEVLAYLNNSNFLINHFLHSEISPFNSGISALEYNKLVTTYLKNHNV